MQTIQEGFDNTSLDHLGWRTHIFTACLFPSFVDHVCCRLL